VRAYLQERVDAGMQYFVTMIGGHDHETLRLLAAEVLPQLTSAPRSGEDGPRRALSQGGQGQRGGVRNQETTSTG
jgi:hypothetical protein